MSKWSWVVEKLKEAKVRWDIDLRELISMAEDIDKKVEALYHGKGEGMWKVMKDIEDREVNLNEYPEFYLSDILHRVIENPDYCSGCVISGGDCNVCLIGNLYGWCNDDSSLVGKFKRKLKDKSWELMGAVFVDKEGNKIG